MLLLPLFWLMANGLSLLPQKNLLPFLVAPCILEIKMNTHPQFFAFTYRYWFSIAALADVHI